MKGAQDRYLIRVPDTQAVFEHRTMDPAPQGTGLSGNVLFASMNLPCEEAIFAFSAHRLMD